MKDRRRAAPNAPVRFDHLDRALEFPARHFGKARRCFPQRLVIDRLVSLLPPAGDPKFAESAVAIVNQERLRRRIADLVRWTGHPRESRMFRA